MFIFHLGSITLCCFVRSWSIGAEENTTPPWGLFLAGGVQQI